MAAIKWRVQNLSGNRVRVYASKRLDCGCTVKESGQARTEKQGREAVGRLLGELISGHECDR